MHRQVVQNDFTAYFVVLAMVALMIYGKMQMFKDDGTHTSNKSNDSDNSEDLDNKNKKDN